MEDIIQEINTIVRAAKAEAEQAGATARLTGIYAGQYEYMQLRHTGEIATYQTRGAGNEPQVEEHVRGVQLFRVIADRHIHVSYKLEFPAEYPGHEAVNAVGAVDDHQHGGRQP